MRLKLVLTLFYFLAFLSSQAQNTLYFTENEVLYRKGLELMDKSDYAAARNTFEEFQRTTDNGLAKIDAQYYEATCALTLFHEDGKELLEKFINQHPEHHKTGLAYFELGNFYFGQKKYTEAITYLSKVDLSLITTEQRQETRFKLGYSHFAKRKFKEALTYFNVLKDQKGRYSSASSYYAGYIEYENGEYNKAIVDLEKASKNAAYARVVPSMLANLYYKQKRYDDLIAYGEKVMQSKNRPNLNDFYKLMGDAYLNKKDFEKAAEYYDRYTSAKKKATPDIQYRAGYVNYRLGNLDKAIGHLKKAASDKDSIGIYASYYLGSIYLKKGNKLYAQTAFDYVRKSELNRELTEEGTYQYGKINYDLGRSEEAINVFNEFSQAYPGSKHSDEVNDLLSSAYLTSNNYDLAIEHIEGLPSVNYNLQQVYQKATALKATELFNNARYQPAIKLFEKSLKYPIDANYTAMANFWTAESYAIGKKYGPASPYYRAVLTDTKAQSSQYYLDSRYGLGYALYNSQKYDLALVQFKEYVNALRNASDKRFYEDALLRLADCYYISKQYDQALVYYNQAIKHNRQDNDYAHLQAGTVMGIQENMEALGEYDYIIKNYPKSSYVDDAMFQKAQLLFEKGNYDEAAKSFSVLISKKSKSKYAPFAYQRRALANYNLKNYSKSIDDYKKILETYPGHSVASETLLPLQEVLNLEGRSDEFSTYLAAYKSVNPNKEGLEGVEFETAKNHYFNLKYQKAISAFQNYIRSYPKHAGVTEAEFFIAESHYRLNEFDKALEVYNEILAQGTFGKLNRVVARIAEIEYREGRYENATYFYYQMAELAGTKKEKSNAWSGLMQSYYFLNKFDSTDFYARTILEKGNVNISSQNRASLYLGKSAFAQGDYTKAQDEFLNTLNIARDQYGAEAQYLLGYTFYQEKQYQKSIEALIALNNNFNVYENWVGKSYLLLADNYVALDDIFQAKGTLQSVIDNFPLDDIKEAARKKMIEVEAKEADLKNLTEEEDTLFIEDEAPEEGESPLPDNE